MTIMELLLVVLVAGLVGAGASAVLSSMIDRIGREPVREATERPSERRGS